MALRIEIKYIKYNKKWELRIGDISGASETSNISAQEVLDEIADRMKEMEELKHE